MVRFVNGKADKKNYRHFNIKTVTGANDFASMNEIVGRRYKRIMEEAGQLPDLIIVDGGKGQLSSACDALKELGIGTWFAGLRRSQAASRAALNPLEVRDGRFKVHPIFDWSDRDVYLYLKAHGLSYHPLWDKGYVSIGDWHSTKSLSEVESAEELRFAGLKRECGIHGLEG